jgi:hypothetical protein
MITAVGSRQGEGEGERHAWKGSVQGSSNCFDLAAATHADERLNHVLVIIIPNVSLVSLTTTFL